MHDRFQKALDALFRDHPKDPEHPVVTAFREAFSLFDELQTTATPRPSAGTRPPKRSKLADVTAERDALREQLATLAAERDAWKKAYGSLEKVVNEIRALIITAPKVAKPDSAC